MASRSTKSRGARAASSTDGRIDEASLVGMRLGERYRLLELIGEGGMGGVFRAAELATGRVVALKLLHPELAHIEYVARRFEREARVASGLSHPNIVEVFDHGEANGHLYLAMELLGGSSLSELLARGELGVGGKGIVGRARRWMTARRAPTDRIAHTIAIMRQVLEALEHAHGRGVVHRDLKPDNIMLVPSRSDGAIAEVKLLDFGIAKLADEAPGQKPLTQAGIPLGTPHYMSPEQAAGDTTDERSDLYSCGVILYEMLTGRPPFDAPSTVQLLSMQVTAPPQPLRAIAPTAQIPEALERVVMRALAKRPDDRFDSAKQMRRALAGEVAPDATEPAIVRHFRRRRTRWIVATATAIVTAVTALVLAEVFASRPPPSASATLTSSPAPSTLAKPTNPAHNPAGAKRSVRAPFDKQ
jgi:serine/threonine-protein kinase